MSYQDLPDPRPTGVRLALRRLTRLAAVTVAVCLACAGLGAVAVAFLDSDHMVLWGCVALAGAFASFHYISAIRWADEHQAWPRRRSYRRHRSTSL
jgi:hypothetical protein